MAGQKIVPVSEQEGKSEETILKEYFRRDCCQRKRTTQRFIPSCYKVEMPKIIEQWLFFKHIGGEFTPLSKPFKLNKLAEKEREKYPERERRKIGLGLIRVGQDKK